MNKKIASFFEGVIIAAIILVLIQTFMEDLAVFLSWVWSTRKVLIITGFCFDLLFTIEFLVRLYFAIINQEVKEYFIKRRGWVDLVASVPLILLNSGPAVIALAAGGVSVLGLGSILNVLKVIKAIRIARILRLLRVLKIFKQIKYADSPMAQRHVAKITSMTVSVFVFCLLAISLVSGIIHLPAFDSYYNERIQTSVNYIEKNQNKIIADDEFRSDYLSFDKSVLLIRDGDKTIYSLYPESYYIENTGMGDYDYYSAGDLDVYFDLRPLNIDQARQNMIFFIIIVAIVFAFLLFYSPHFAITVTDPIHVMKRGYEEKSYNLEVKVLEEYKQDDVFNLAALYNEVYLPLKDRTSGDDTADNLELKMDDLKDLLD
jgi:hypothetical protein